MARTNDSAEDNELRAIAAILGALRDLDGESTQRVLDYVFRRLSLGSLTHSGVPPTVVTSTVTASEPTQTRQFSIRDLKDEKKPESSNQMAALVAYHLSEVAPEVERKETVSASDLERYFKQAGFKLPKAIGQTLQNAAAAGYFDGVGNGQYRLNPVGYNLVAHGLPREHRQTEPKRSLKRTTKRR